MRSRAHPAVMSDTAQMNYSRVPERNVATNNIRVNYDNRNLRSICDTPLSHCEDHRLHARMRTSASPSRIHRKRPTTTENSLTIFMTRPVSHTTESSTNAPPLSSCDTTKPRQSNHEVRTKDLDNSKIKPPRLPSSTHHSEPYSYHTDTLKSPSP